jgi:RimJ/RimL family protein N-acetyltransferase
MGRPDYTARPSERLPVGKTTFRLHPSPIRDHQTKQMSPLIQNGTAARSTTEARVDSHVQIRTAGPRERDLLVAMYDSFEPLGVAFGLPPFSEEARRNWIAFALTNEVNIVALAADGAAVGHCFLAADQSRAAEIAIFVRQEYRRRGIGRALVQAALEHGARAGLRRVWSMTSPDNRPALRLQESCGFRVTKFAFPGSELEIELSPASAV